jgi:Ca2+-binding EF-hand superfamily protein
MDDDGSQALSYTEFKKGIRECALNIDDDACRKLFQHFDKDGNGEVDFEEFLTGIRGVLNDRRRGLVELAFGKIDKDGNGTIEPQDIVDCYDASKHPDVIAGKKTPDEIFREFLDTFDVGGEVDGKVTQNEFMNYYANVSASIDDDDYFELMIRNAWHISGGEGWSANSSNRRVLVTHADGRQTVEEIRDDLGVKADDKEEMMRRLRSQGIDPSNIALFGGGTDGVEGTDGPVNQGPSLSSSAPSRRSNPSFRSSFQLG